MNPPRPPLRIRLVRAFIRSLPRGRYPMMNWLERWSRTPGAFWGSLGPCRFMVDLQDLVAREVYFTGCHEHGFSALLHSVLRPGDVFVDVGANFGYFSLMARAVVGPLGRCVAFEPDPVNVERMKANLSLNGFSDCLIVPKLCGAAPGTSVFYGISRQEENWGMGSRYAQTALSRRMEVPLVRLDDELESLGVNAVRLCKMDIEGGEMDAMIGLRRYLERGAVDCLLIECHESILKGQGVSARPILDMLLGNGYEIRNIRTPRGAYSIERFQGSLEPLDIDRLEPWFHMVAFLPNRCNLSEGLQGSRDGT